MAPETTLFDAAEYLGDIEGQAFLLSDAVETGNAAYITHALGIVVRAREMSQIANDAGDTDAPAAWRWTPIRSKTPSDPLP